MDNMEVDDGEPIEGLLSLEMKEKVQKLKNQLLWDYCTSLLEDIQLPILEPLRYEKGDTESEKRDKLKDFNDRRAEFGEKRLQLEPELMRR